MGLKIFQWNCNGISTKRGDLLKTLACHRPDIVILQESKLQPSQVNKPENIPLFPGYQIFRKDRTVADGGGGLLTLVKLSLNAQECDSPFDPPASVNDNLEFLFVKVWLTAQQSIIVGNLYNPPTNSLQLTYNPPLPKNLIISGDSMLTIPSGAKALRMPMARQSIVCFSKQTFT